MPASSSPTLIPLWDDNPSSLDLLGFEELCAPILTALSTPAIDPLTLGIHGAWGSGKSTLLGLVAKRLEGDPKYVVIQTNPWEYEDTDVKGTLIGAVLDALQEKIKANQSWLAAAGDRVAELATRVSWSRITSALAKGAITMSWNPTELLGAFNPIEDQKRSLAGFRSEFGVLLDKMDGVERVVVLVDDLDRCLPPAVVGTLEAIKLFLSVRKMVFVIAADQDLVRDAIAASIPGMLRSERFAANYLQKIVQIPVSLPQLPRHDAEAFIGMLLCQEDAATEGLKALAQHCGKQRALGRAPLLSDLSGLAFVPAQATLRLAAQIAHGLGADRVRNPREIKRFMNAFGVRRTIADARRIKIDPDLLVKLLILEERYRAAFDQLAGLPAESVNAHVERWEKWARGEADAEAPGDGLEPTRDWASSEPFLAGKSIATYITLAATLASSSLTVSASPELIDLVYRILGESDADRQVAIDEVKARSSDDVMIIARAIRDEMRRSSQIDLHTQALSELSQTHADLAKTSVEWLNEIDRKLFTPSVVVTLATSNVNELTAFCKTLEGDERMSAASKAAISEAIV